jgi:biopolymer transport protein ExbB
LKLGKFLFAVDARSFRNWLTPSSCDGTVELCAAQLLVTCRRTIVEMNTKKTLVLTLLLALAAMLVGAAIDTPIAAAQEEAAPAAPAADAAAADAPAAAAPAAAPAPAERSRFWWFIESSGWIGLFILCLSIYFVATIIRLFIELRPVVAMPPEEVAQCEQFLNARDYQGLYDFSSKQQSLYSRLVSVGIAELPSGLAEAREVMDRNADAETVDMEKKISMLAVIGTLGPMIGLVGTLKGMISSFAVIALSDTQMKASEVAAGISEALLLTFEGVALSVPAIYFFAVFKNRVAKISVETLLAADELVRRLVQQAKQKPAPGTHAAAPVTARA